MKSKTNLAKKLLAILLSVLIAWGVATPAFALQDISVLDPNEDRNEVEIMLDRDPLSDKYQIGYLYEYFKAVEKDAKAPQTFAQSAAKWFDYGLTGLTYISSVVNLVNSVVSILQMCGVIKSETEILGEKIQYISESLQSVQLTVDEIDRKTDAILNNLTNEFTDIDLKLMQQDYNHYKDDVWGRFYTDALLPMKTLQTQYGDDINWLLVSYAEQWQNGNSKTDLRSLFGRNEEGELIQVYSGKNIGDAGKALPKAPAKSIDSLKIDYAVTLPSEYISRNIDKNITLNSKNCLDALAQAVKKGVYEAAEKGELSAYGGFDAEWRSLNEETKQQKAKEYAAYLTDALFFACSYTEANEKNFASDVKTAYQTFTKWLSGSDSLTSPLVAQFKMLSLTHAFEYEVIDQVNSIGYGLCTMNMSYFNFAQTVLSMSKAYGEKANKDVSDMYENAERAMATDYLSFVTGNPNFCYMTESVLEYKPVTVESTITFIYDEPQNPEYIGQVVNYDGHESGSNWRLFEKGKNKESDSVKSQSQSELLGKTITTKEARLIYAMYKSNGGSGSFGDYLAQNKVVADADDVTKNVITSFNMIGLDLGIDTDLICHYAAGVAEYGHHDYTEGKTYAVPGGVKGRLDDNDNYHVTDKAIGGVFNTVTGKSDENGTIASRAFYGDELKIYAFSDTDFTFTREKLSRDKIAELHLEERGMSNTLYTATDTFSSAQGMLVSAEPKTYTFPSSTKSIPDNFFGSASEIEKLVFDGTPETIADNAFSGVGTPAKRCFIKAPFATGSLVNAWHGGYFGNTNITVEKNDGSGEKETIVAVAGAPISSVVCTFTAPEHAAFDGWSFYPNGVAADPDESVPIPHTTVSGTILYAVWKYDHEHDFEVTKEAVAATCTQNGSTQEKTCKICGYKEVDIIPATGHSCEYYKDTITGEYIAQCSHHDYYAHLYPRKLGYHTVWSENKSGDDVELAGYTWIKEDGVYVIESNNPGDKLDKQTVKVKDGVTACICLAGVELSGSADVVGLDIGKSNVHLTLNGENKITCYQSNPFVCEGNLTIDGTGSLTVTTDTYFTPITCIGENTVINGGCIRADGGYGFSVKINDDKTGGKLIITENASVYAKYGIDAAPINEKGERVYPLTIPNSNFDTITVDGEALPHWVTDGDGKAYVYITAGEHEILVGSERFSFTPFEESNCFEKQYGDLIVLNPTGDPNVVSYIKSTPNDSLIIKKTTPITIKNANPDKAAAVIIYIYPEVDADITLAGVNMDVSKTDASAILISTGTYVAGNVKITLAKDTENIVCGGTAGISLEGRYGSLTVDGEGTLTVTGARDSAAIGSVKNKSAGNITINGGTVYANVRGSEAAAIGSGKIEAGASIESGYAVNNITINGGTVYANSDKAPAVGAGVCEQNLPAQNITVNGGMLIANSNSADYTVGGEKTSEVVINGGIVTANGSTESKGGITASKTVIEKTASVKATRVNSPVNGMNESVKLNVIPIEIGEKVSIDGKGYRCIGHNGENKMYLYLTDPNEVKKVHGITLENTERGKVYYSPSIPMPGETVTLSAVAEEGYAFVDYEITPAVEIKDGTFIMPDEDVTIKGVFAKISTVTVSESEHGKVLPSKSIVTAGEKVSLYVMPEDGYELDTLTLTPANIADGKYAFTMPEENVTISGTFKPKKHTLTWNVDGKKTETVLTFGSKITAPEDPKKEGYNFMGWTPAIPDTMPDSDMEFFAVFEPITYKAKFKADGKEIAAVDYTLNMIKLDEPAVPKKDGYTGKWESYSLTAGGITVNAQYTPEIYIARFVADGKVVKDVEYTVQTLEITEPAVPEKDGYTGRWSDYDLRIGGVTVKAIYTAGEVHQHTFETKYSHNDAAHWFASTCGHDIAASLAPHTFGEGIVSGDTTSYICSECGYVKTVVNTEAGKARELEKSINAAKDALDKAALGGDGEVMEFAETVKTELEAKTDISSVNEKLVAALEEINGMKTEKAIANALQYLDTVAGGFSSSEAKSAVNQAKTAVKKAQTPEEVNAILADALGEIEAAEQELGNICPICGKAHKDNLWGRIICFFVRAYKWINKFISKVF